MNAEEQVRAVLEDAFLDKYECDEGCKHYRILGRRRIITMYFDSPEEAWADAASRLQGIREELRRGMK